MNETVNKFLLGREKLCLKYTQGSLDLHIVLVDHLKKAKKECKRLKKQEIHDIFIETNQVKLVFNVTDFKDLTRRISPAKILRNKAFNIAKNPKHDGYQRELASILYKFFDKKTSGGGIKNENMSNKELAKVLLKPVTKKFDKMEVNHLLQIIFIPQIQQIGN